MLLAITVMCAFVQAQPDAEAQKVLQACAKKYQDLETFKTGLKVTANLADKEIVQTGSMILKRGGKVALKLKDDSTQQWTALHQCDGTHRYQLDPARKAILKRSVDPAQPVQNPYFFPGFERYDLSTARLEETVLDKQGRAHRVSVEIKDSTDKIFRYVRLLIREETGVIEQMEFMSQIRRALMTIRFTDVAIDKVLDDSEFRWTRPADLQDVPVVDEKDAKDK